MQKTINKTGLIQALKDISGYGDYENADIELILTLYGMIKAGDLKKVIEYAEKIQALKIANV